MTKSTKACSLQCISGAQQISYITLLKWQNNLKKIRSCSSIQTFYFFQFFSVIKFFCLEKEGESVTGLTQTAAVCESDRSSLTNPLTEKQWTQATNQSLRNSALRVQTGSDLGQGQIVRVTGYFHPIVLILYIFLHRANIYQGCQSTINNQHINHGLWHTGCIICFLLAPIF